MRRLFLSLLIMGALAGHAWGQTYKPITGWPIPSSGSQYISNGDAAAMTRGGITYKLVAGWGGVCGTNAWVSSINSQGIPVCTQPFFSNIGGFVSLSQLAGSYTNGQMLIGNTSTGQLQAGSITAGSNVTVTNSAAGVTIAANTSSGVLLGTTTPNPISQNGSAGLVGNGSSVGIQISGVELFRFNSTGLGIGTTNIGFPLQVIGTASASSYFAGATQGVTCSGSPTSSFASVNGIVVHC